MRGIRTETAIRDICRGIVEHLDGHISHNSVGFGAKKCRSNMVYIRSLENGVLNVHETKERSVLGYVKD